MSSDESVTQSVEPRPTDQKPRQRTVEDQVQEVVSRLAAYWLTACADAWRTVFPSKEDYR